MNTLRSAITFERTHAQRVIAQTTLWCYTMVDEDGVESVTDSTGQNDSPKRHPFVYLLGKQICVENTQSLEPNSFLSKPDTIGGQNRPVLETSSSQRSPKRGLLRAVSSITITDIEVLGGDPPSVTEGQCESSAVAIETETHNRRPYKEPCDVLPLAPIRSPSGYGVLSTRVGAKHATPASTSEAMSNFPATPRDTQARTVEEEKCAMNEPRVGEDYIQPLADSSSNSQPIRRKSLDLVPNVPRRTSSQRRLLSRMNSDDSTDVDAELELLVQALGEHSTRMMEGSKVCTVAQDQATSRKSLDSLPSVPRRSLISANAGQPFDRFHHSPCDFTVLKRHQSLDGIPAPPPRPGPSSYYDEEQDSESEFSPCCTSGVNSPSKEFTSRKLQGRDNQYIRRRSFDSFPLSPEQCVEDSSPRPKMSLGGIPMFPILRSTQDTQLETPVSIIGSDSQTSSPLGIDFSRIRRKSVDLVPSLPRRRMPSDGSDSPLEVAPNHSPSAVNTIVSSTTTSDGDIAIRRKSLDTLPSVPQRTGSTTSGLAPKSSSRSRERKQLDTTKAQSRPEHADDDLVGRNRDLSGDVALRRKRHDVVPNLPRRDSYQEDDNCGPENRDFPIDCTIASESS